MRGLRIHEFQVGFLVLAAAAIARGFGWIGSGQLFYAIVIAGAWLVAKDWRDITPHRRDTGSWSLWFHRPVPLLRAHHRGAWVPRVLGMFVGVTAAINLVSALTPSLTNRLHLLDRVVPNGLATEAHALSVPASAALLVVSWQLIKRRHAGWVIAVALLILLGALNLVKGLDVEEAAITWLLAGGLWLARPAFYVEAPPSQPRSHLVRLPAIGAAAFATAFATVLLLGHSGPSRSPASHADAAVSLLIGSPTGLDFGSRFGWLPFAFAAVGSTVLFAAIFPFLRRHAHGIGVSAVDAVDEARAVMRRFGGDTLSFFTLRADHRYLFSDDRRAYLAFQVEGGVLTVAGDPVGDDRAFPGLVAELAAITERRGLRIAVVAAGTGRLDLWHQLGLRRVYLGDEAIVATGSFSLEGRTIRKVRQSVTRLERAGYTVATRSVGDLTPNDLAALDEVSAGWRAGRSERGFSMSLDRVGGDVQSDCVVVAASDPDGVVRGFLHFVPVYGRPAMSLSLMRADRTAPNGLTEFLVCSAISDLRAAGIEDLSLNFATFGRVLRAPSGRVERLLGRLIRAGDGAFQVSSLLSFNDKFSPRWEPRYFLCETIAGAPRAGLAAAWLEGQVPRLRFPRPARWVRGDAPGVESATPVVVT